MMMKLYKLSAVVIVVVASMARANKARPSSALDNQQQRYLTTRRSLLRGDGLFGHNDSGKGKGGSKKSKGSKTSKGSMSSSTTSSSSSSTSDQSPPTSAPTSLLSCPCFNSTAIDFQVEVLEETECITNASAPIIGLSGFRPNANSTRWIAFAGFFNIESPPVCAFEDPANGLDGFDDFEPPVITSDELQACQSILLGSQMFAVNENCTVVG